jgi:hypothetical protein
MLFNNPEIIHSSSDIRIGGVDFDQKSNVTYYDFIVKVKSRILKMVCEFVKSQMADGMTKEEAQAETLGVVYGYLNIGDKTYDNSEEGIVQEILNSDEYKKWQSNMYYRWKNAHAFEGIDFGVLPVTIDKTTDEESEEQNLFTILDGLIAQYK